MKLLLNVGRAWPEVEHVYLVGYRNYAVGRMWFAVDRQADPRPWEWHLSIPMTLPDDSKGIARSMAEAVQDLGNALHRLILQTPHDRLERAFQFGAAAGLNFDEGEDVEVVVEEAVSPQVSVAQVAQVVAKDQPVAGLARRAAQTHTSVAARPPTNTQTVPPKKRAPIVRVQVARPAQQPAAPRPVVVATSVTPAIKPSASDTAN